MTGVVDEIYMRNVSRPMRIKNVRNHSPMSFVRTLKEANESGRIGLIGEFKRTSPSGFLNISNESIHDYLAKVTGEGADGLSILTEPDYFHGSNEDLAYAQEFGIPVLAKDFFSTTGMIDSAYNSGTDAVLLIADFLADYDLKRLCSYAHRRGLEVITEFHDLSRADSAIDSGADMIGYNRRNLRILKMDGHEREAIRSIERFQGIKILESGLNMDNIDRDITSEYNAVLVGEALLNNQNIMEKLKKIRVR